DFSILVLTFPSISSAPIARCRCSIAAPAETARSGACWHAACWCAGAVKDLESDLVDHVAEHLGVDRSEALSRLGDWLSAYEPVRPRRIQVLTVLTGPGASGLGQGPGPDP